MIVAQQKFLKEIFAEHPKFCVFHFELFIIQNSKFSSEGGSLPAGRQAPSAEKFIFGIASSRNFGTRNDSMK